MRSSLLCGRLVKGVHCFCVSKASAPASLSTRLRRYQGYLRCSATSQQCLFDKALTLGSKKQPGSRQFMTTSQATQEGGYDGMPKLLVFGGNGYVGSRVCEEALKTGLQIVSINRSGRPRGTQPWINEVDWFQADVFNVNAWKAQLKGAIGLVSCLGAFGSNDFMFKICGESNALVFREAAAARVARATFVSVADYKLPGPVLRGYFEGKRHAEDVLMQTFPQTGVALRPGFIHGTRDVGGIGIPLGLVGAPLQKVLSYVPSKELAKYPGLALAFVPPVGVNAIAKAAVAAATDSAVQPGILDCWQIQKFGE